MSQFRPTYPVLRWTLVVAGMLAVAWAAIVAIGRLQTEATGARDSQFELVSLRLDLAQIQQVPWGAAPDEGDELDSGSRRAPRRSAGHRGRSGQAEP